VGAIRAAGAQVVEVRFTRWDGEEHSEVSAACRGVIAGFGMEGVAAAVGLLVQEIAAAAG
jgi:3-dehydroquinate dehydratase